MEEKEKQKNLLDLKHQANLNYFNIVVLSIITVFVAIIFNYKTTVKSGVIISLVILVFLGIFLTWLLFQDNIKKIRMSIGNL